MAVIKKYDIDISAVESKLKTLQSKIEKLTATAKVLGIDTKALDEASAKIEKISKQPIANTENISTANSLLTGLNDTTTQAEITAKAYAKVHRDEVRTAVNETANAIKAQEAAAAGEAATYNQLQAQLRALGTEIKNTPLNDPRLPQMREEFDKLNTRLKEVDATMGNFQRNVGDYAQTKTPSLREQVRLLRDEMVALERAGQGNSEAYDEAGRQLGLLRDAMQRASSVAKDYANDTRTLANSMEFIKLGVNAYSAVQSSMVAFGVENESLQRTMQRMMAVQSALNAIQQVNVALNDDASIVYRTITKLKAAFTKTTQAQTTAMQGEAAATNTATVATKGFSKALLATGIGAIVVAVGALIAYWDDIVGFFKSFTKGARDSAIEQAALNGELEEFVNKLNKYGTGVSSGVAATSALAAANKALNVVYVQGKAIRSADSDIWKSGVYEITNLTDATKVYQAAQVGQISLDEEQIEALEQYMDAERRHIERINDLNSAQGNNLSTGKQLIVAIKDMNAALKGSGAGVKDVATAYNALRRYEEGNLNLTIQQTAAIQKYIDTYDRHQKQLNKTAASSNTGTPAAEPQADERLSYLDSILTAEQKAEVFMTQFMAEQERIRVENHKAALDEQKLADEQRAANVMTTFDYQAGLQAKQKEEDELTRKEQEEGEKKAMQGRIATISAVGDALGGLGELVGEENEAYKGIMIGQTVASTIAGAMGAFNQAMGSIPPPFNVPVAVASAAAVTLQGAAAIKNITASKKQLPNTGSGANSPAVPTTTTPTVTDQLTGEYYRSAVNGELRVVVLASDIETALGDRRVVASTSNI